MEQRPNYGRFTPHSIMGAICLLFLLINSVHGLTFNDPDSSYVMYNPPWSPSGEVQAISLEFRTVTGNALLFAHHYLRENETKYVFDVDQFAVVLQITSGRIKATHFYTTITESITAGDGVNDDKWHTLSFSVNPETGIMSLTVDDQTASATLRSYQYAAARSILQDKFGENPSAVVYLGGLPAQDVSTLPLSYPRMMGCINDVRFQSMLSSSQANATSAAAAATTAAAAPATSAPGATTNPAATSAPGATPAPATNATTAPAAAVATTAPDAATTTEASRVVRSNPDTTTGAPAAGNGTTVDSTGEATPTESLMVDVPIAYRVMVEDGCVDECEISNPCEHGQCVNHYFSLSCDCFMSGYEGALCDQEGATPVTLGGFQYINYILYLGNQDTYTAQNLISMRFKTNPAHQSGVLYYAVGALPVQTYLAVFIQDGQLSVNIKYGATDVLEFLELGVVNDNVWHLVSVEQDDRTVSVTVDNVTMTHSITGANKLFTFDPISHIGGGDGLDGYPGLPVHTNFVGCMKEVYIDRFDITASLQDQSSSTRVSFVGGEPLLECWDIDVIPVTFPTPESYIHLESWLEGDFTLSFDFRTPNTTSLMMTAHLYMNETNQGRLTLELVNGSLQVKLGTDPHVPLSLDYIHSLGARLHDGLWHQVDLTVSGKNATLELDEESVTFSFYETLTPRGAVYLGGWNLQPDGFEGCMQNIYMQGELLMPTEVVGTLVMKGVTLDGCPIAGNPCVAGDVVCANGGTCVEEDGEPVCVCTDPKYTGARCQFYTYKSSCAEYFYSGDTRSGAKLVDLDGAGPFEPFYMNCDFSKGNTAFEVAHNLRPDTLVRQIDTPHLEFDIEYQFMTHSMLRFLVDRSRTCHQYFNYHCFDAPLGLDRITTLTAVTGKTVSKKAMPFIGDCDRGRKTWMRDSGNITSMFYLPITRLDFKPPGHSSATFTKATLTLGPLRCEDTLGYTYAYTVSLLNQEQHLPLKSWTKGSFSFSFRTRDLNSVLFHQRSTWKHPNFLMASITGTHTLTLELHMNGHIQMKEITSSRQLTDGQWHTITMQKTDYEIHVTIDFDRASLMLPIGQKMDRFYGALHIGGSDILPSGFHGMSGCISGVLVNGKYQFIYDFYNEFTNAYMKPGCSSACDKQPCQNGGECLDEWGTYTCRCHHPALLGQSCENDKRLDTVNFKQNSAFVNFDPSDNAVLTGTFHLGFRTFQTDALLFYAYDQFGNFVQLDLEASDAVVMKFNDGQKVVQLVTTMNATALNNGDWVEVSVLRNGQSITLEANGVASNVFAGNATLLTAEDTPTFTGVPVTVRPLLPFEGPSESFVKVYVGGVPEGTTTIPTLQGCLRGLVVSGEGWDLQEKAQGQETMSTTCSDHCHPSNPCMNGGTCVEMWDSFECNCTTTSYTGKTCQSDIGATFKEGAALLYPLLTSEDLETDELYLGFSTTAPSGTIFYVRNDFKASGQQKYISVSLENGHLKFMLNFDAEHVEELKMGPFNDGYRHSVVLKRFGRRVLIDVDNQGGSFTTLLPSVYQFDGRDAVVIGGVENNMSMFAEGGYQGCITSLYYNRITPLELDIDGLGTTKSECAAFESSSSTATMTTDMPVNPLQEQDMTMPPWNVPQALGQEIAPEESEKEERDLLLMGIIIAVFVVAFLILIICIIVTVTSIKKNGSGQAGDKDEGPKENDVLLEQGRGDSAGRGNRPSSNKRPPSAEISVKELEWDPQIEKNMPRPELEWDNTSYTNPDTPLATPPNGTSQTPSDGATTPRTPKAPSPTLLQLAANHTPQSTTTFPDYAPSHFGFNNICHIQDTPV